MKWLSPLLMKFWLVGSIVVYTPHVNCHVRSVWHTTQAEARNCACNLLHAHKYAGLMPGEPAAASDICTASNKEASKL